MIENRLVPRAGNFDTILFFVEKNPDDDQESVVHLPYYMIRCQQRAMQKQIDLVKESYPNMVIIETECDDANAIDCWNRFRNEHLTRDNYFRNHFSIPEDLLDLFEGLFVVLP